MKTRWTSRKTAILEFLEDDEHCYQEYGTPPYNATTIANQTEPEPSENGDWRATAQTVQSVARTLRGMTKEGLLVAVRNRQEVWNAIAGNGIDMPVTAYYSARTMERDKQLAQAWQDGAAERSERAFQSFAAAIAQSKGLPVPEFAQPALAAPVEPQRVIDMGAAEIVEPSERWAPF
jgi:hypothetical protein